MKLIEHIELNKIDKAQFARLIGVTTVSLARYLNGSRRPEWPVLKRIARFTNGAVMPNDFLGEYEIEEAA